MNNTQEGYMIPMMSEKMKPVPREESEKTELIHRLHRLCGQIKGIEKMIEEDRYCKDVLMQVTAAQSALHNLGCKILETHIKTCVVQQIEEGTADLDELIELIRKLK